jgi:hypothetical protein
MANDMDSIAYSGDVHSGMHSIRVYHSSNNFYI